MAHRLYNKVVRAVIELRCLKVMNRLENTLSSVCKTKENFAFLSLFLDICKKNTVTNK